MKIKPVRHFHHLSAKPPCKKCEWLKMFGIIVTTEKVALAYTVNSEWRNRNAFLNSRAEIVEFLKRMWASKHAYRLFDWPQGRRPHAHKGLSELGL